MDEGYYLQARYHTGPMAGIWHTIAQNAGPMSYEEALEILVHVRADAQDTDYRIVRVEALSD